MNLEMIMVSERSQNRRDTHLVGFHVHERARAGRSAETESQLVVVRSRKNGVMGSDC